jgi:hypothetical protein
VVDAADCCGWIGEGIVTSEESTKEQLRCTETEAEVQVHSGSARHQDMQRQRQLKEETGHGPIEITHTPNKGMSMGKKVQEN